MLPTANYIYHRPNDVIFMAKAFSFHICSGNALQYLLCLLEKMKETSRTNTAGEHIEKAF